MQASFVICVDFESSLKQNQNDADTSYTDKYWEHIEFNYCYKVACTDDRLKKPVQIYWGKKWSFLVNWKKCLKRLSIVKKLWKTLEKNLSWLKKIKDIIEKLTNFVHVKNWKDILEKISG